MRKAAQCDSARYDFCSGVNDFHRVVNAVGDFSRDLEMYQSTLLLLHFAILVAVRLNAFFQCDSVLKCHSGY
jgi:hypothetical protein